MEKEEAFEGASDKKVTLALVGPSSGVMRLAQLVARRFNPVRRQARCFPRRSSLREAARDPQEM